MTILSILHRTLRYISLCLCSALLLISSIQQAFAVIVIVDDDVLSDYQHFVGPRDPLTIETYSGPHARRDVIELLLLVQILDAGGLTTDIRFHNEHSYQRILSLIAAGDATIYGTPVWQKDIAQHPSKYWSSEPMVRNGEFIVGLYTSKYNLHALEATNENIVKLTAVSSKQWSSDWATLENIGLNALYNVNNWENMIKMVAAQRADFTLSPFYPSKDMALTLNNLSLIPIPNIRIALNGSRHWAVSKKHPESEAIQNAIATGMALFRERGIITRAYQESGFFDQRVSNWPVLNAD